MIRQRSKKEIIEVIRARYLKVTKQEKQQVLDQVVSAIGYLTNMASVCSGIQNKERVSGKREDTGNAGGKWYRL